MEVMQLREREDKKREALHHLKDEVLEVEEVMDEALVGRRRSPSSNHSVNAATVTGDESSTRSSLAGTGSSYKIVDVALNTEVKLPAGEEVDNNNDDKSKRSVHLDESEGASEEGFHADKIPKVESLSSKLKDVDIQKVLSAVINGENVELLKETFPSGPILPPSTKPQEGDGETSAGTEHLKIDLVDENEDEVLELEFERAVEKMHTHEYNMHCPNCSSRITKVILRRRKRTQSQDLLGCLSCFSIFIPKGNILDPFNIFGRRKAPQSKPSHQPQQPGLAPGSAVQQQQTPGGFIPDKGEDPFWTSGKQPVTGDSSNSQQSSPPINGASQLTKPNNNVDGVVPPAGTSNGVSSVDGSISKGDVIIHIPSKPDGTTQGTKHPMKPITDIEEGQNVTNGQYPGGYVQSPPGQRPDPADPSQFPGNLPDAKTPPIPIQEQSSKPLEILKSIVYGGLMELITSLSIVSSAAASDATTLNIVVLGLANLVGGLGVLFHNLKELRYEESNEANEEVKSRYHEQLGRKENFLLHTVFAVLSYLVFGLIPPVVYGFMFRDTDDRDFKLLAVAASSLVCIIILAIAKAYTRRQHNFTAYGKTVLYHVTGAVMVSGIAYAAGHLFERLMDWLGWFDSNPAKHLLTPENKTWASF